MMSAKRTAASTPSRRTGWSVTSAQSSGVPPSSKNEWRSRSARYSGSERPAWRMNHTGVRSTCSRRSARTKRGSDTRPRQPRRCSVPSHPVPAGPLAVRWLAFEVCALQAGAHRPRAVELENAGQAAWRGRLRLVPLARRPRQRNRLGRPAHADAAARDRRPRRGRAQRPRPDPARALPARVRPRARRPLLAVGDRQRAPPRPPRGREARRRGMQWRISRRTSSRQPTGTSSSGLRTRRATPPSAVRSTPGRRRELRRLPAGGGRNPASRSLVCPSLIPPLEPNCDVAGLPAWRPETRRALALRAVDLRRPDHSSTAIWSSTRLKTHAPSSARRPPRRTGRPRPTRPAARP